MKNQPCFCKGLCPRHASYNRYRVFYNRARMSWAVMAPFGTGKGKYANSFTEAIAYADKEARAK